MREHVDRWQLMGTYLGLSGVAVFVLLPLWALFQMAFDASIQGWPQRAQLWPANASLSVFAEVWQRPAQTLDFLGILRNSLIVAGGSALLAVLLGAGMAYGFARFRFPGKQAGTLGLLLGSLLPPIALLTPLYVLLTIIGIRTSLLGLVVAYTAFALPFCIWNMRASFQAVPRELEEAAFLDGASAFTAFYRVTLPLGLPAIIVAGLIAFLAGYTEFAMGWLFVDRGDNVTLAMAVSGMITQYGAQWNKLAALALMMSVPVVLVFIALQRYLLRGLLFGAVED